MTLRSIEVKLGETLPSPASAFMGSSGEYLTNCLASLVGSRPLFQGEFDSFPRKWHKYWERVK
jgi:hypothetical protein